MAKKPHDVDFEVKKAVRRLGREHPESDGLSIWGQAFEEVEQRRLERAAIAKGKDAE
jgi:hypothetical protein